MAKKGYIYPTKKKIPLTLLLNLFGIFIISQFLRFVNMFYEIYTVPFGRQKRASLREGGGPRSGGRSLRDSDVKLNSL